MALYIGTNYHPHDWTRERWQEDIRLMKEAGFTTVRLGHLCWDSYEPEDGVYTFEWFDEVMDMFAAAGIGVFLDISLRPAPIWVHKLCPGCGICGKSGNMQTSLHRYMEDVDDPAYQHYAFRFAETMVERYKNHPALFAFGLCNEQGDGRMSLSEASRQRFIGWLKKKYGSIEALNRAWAAQRWSRRLTSFDDVVLPENEVCVGPPEAWLDMRRFYSDGIGNFLIKFRRLVAEHAPGVPTSANLYTHAKYLGFDYLKFCEQVVDYPGNGYYPMYEPGSSQHLECLAVIREGIAETGKPLWSLEFQTGRDGIFCGPPGYLYMQLMLGLLNREQMFLGWTWRSMYGGEEQYHHGILAHDGYPTPNYREFVRAAADMKKLERYAFPYLPEPDVAAAFSMESEWVQEYQSGQFRQRYFEGLMEVHRALNNLNREYNAVNLHHMRRQYKLLLVPGQILMSREETRTIRDFVRNGGTVIMTGYSSTVNENGQVYQTPRPGGLDEVFGIRVAGFYRTDMPGFFSENATVKETGGRKRELLRIAKTVSQGVSEIMADIDYYEELELRGAERYADFADKNMCAVSVNRYGAGRAYYVAAESDHVILQWLLVQLTEELGLEKGLQTPEGVQARKLAPNQYFYVNMNAYPVTVSLEQPGRGVLTECDYDKALQLPAYGCELIVGEDI